MEKKRIKNSFETIVEMFKEQGADMVLVCELDKGGMVTGEPYNSKTGESWAMSMISSIDELVACKYKKAVPDEFVKLYEKLAKKLK